MKTYYIAEFAKKLGVYKDTIRNYQKKGLLPDRRNPVNKYRIFTDEDLETARKLVKPTVTVWPKSNHKK